MTCPQGKQSIRWKARHDPKGKGIIQVAFAEQECLGCAAREQCTHSPTKPRELSLRPQAEYEALHRARARQTTENYKAQYAKRAGIEATLAQGIAYGGLRQARYVLAKTTLQEIVMAVVLNLVRLVAWWQETPRASVRHSHFATLGNTS